MTERRLFPAFKEWRVIVDALGAGEQSLILRKGGIAEDRGGFQVTAPRFWLFPTEFHAQREKTKPATARGFEPPPAGARAPMSPPQTSVAQPETGRTEKADVITLRSFAEVVQHAFLTDWSAVAKLDPFHLWTEAMIRDRFAWSKPAGIHALLVRTHRLDTPVTLAITPAMAGCKSWIETEVPFDAHPSSPVLEDGKFQRLRQAIGLDSIASGHADTPSE